MSFGKTLLWAAGIAGVAVGASLRMLQRWEDEGGSARSVAQRRVR